MNRALQCYEIVRLICQEIGSVGSYDRRTLFRFCMTCRNFVEPALDVLWYRLDSLYPLLRCLPSDLYNEEVRLVEGSRQPEFILVSIVFSLLFFFFLILTISCSLFKGQC